MSDNLYLINLRRANVFRILPANGCVSVSTFITESANMIPRSASLVYLPNKQICEMLREKFESIARKYDPEANVSVTKIKEQISNAPEAQFYVRVKNGTQSPIDKLTFNQTQVRGVQMVCPYPGHPDHYYSLITSCFKIV